MGNILLYIVVVILIIIILLLLILFNNKEKLDEIDDNICFGEKNLLELLEKKKELLIELVRDSNNKNSLKNLKSEESTTLFELEKLLYNINDQLNKDIDKKRYVPNKEKKQLLLELNEINDNIEGLISYYNNKINAYNKKYLNKVLNKWYKIFKLNEKKAFNLRKNESYEILKD